MTTTRSASDYGGHLQLLVELAQPAPQLLAHLGVQGAEGLVQEQERRLGGQRARQCHPLALPSGKLVRIAAADPIQLDQLEQFLHRSADLRFRQPLGAGLDAKAEGDVLEDGEVAEQRVVLENEAHPAVLRTLPRRVHPAEQDLSGVRNLQARDGAQERGLPAAGRPQQRHQLPVGDVQRHVLQHLVLSVVGLGEVLDVDAHRAILLSSHSLITTVAPASRVSSEATAKAPVKSYSL